MAAAVTVASSNQIRSMPTTKPTRAGSYALAQIQGDQVCLVQLASDSLSALVAVEATIYRHEFINIFRHSHLAVLHPADVRILEILDVRSVARDDDDGTVTLSRDVMERLGRLMDPRRRYSHTHTHQHPRSITRGMRAQYAS